MPGDQEAGRHAYEAGNGNLQGVGEDGMPHRFNTIHAFHPQVIVYGQENPRHVQAKQPAAVFVPPDDAPQVVDEEEDLCHKGGYDLPLQKRAHLLQFHPQDGLGDFCGGPQARREVQKKQDEIQIQHKGHRSQQIFRLSQRGPAFIAYAEQKVRQDADDEQ